jgi:tripartite-type tricarboxylate transporter receptor subunit TctC
MRRITNFKQTMETSMKKLFVRLAASTLIGVAALGSAFAQEYPTKPVTLLIPFAAGGPTDTVGRQLAIGMAAALKGTVVVENSGGAGGTIGVNKAAKSAPDGYTVLLMHVGISTAPSLYRKLPYDTFADLEPLGQVVDVPMTLVGKKTLEPKTLPELITYLKANKDKVAMANAGIGAASHLCGMLFQSAIQVDLTTIPYKGTGPAMTDLIGGTVDLMCDQTTQTTQHIKAGSIKAYGVTSRTVVSSLPQLKPLAEQGMKDFEVNIWHGMWVPKGTPQPVKDKLIAALKAGIKDPAFQTKMADLGAIVVPESKATPDNLRAHLKAEVDKWAPIIKKAGVYAD